MAMGNSADYGAPNDQTVLVPSSLTCYRHFGLDANPGVQLTPMNRPRDKVYEDMPANGIFDAACHAFRSYSDCDCTFCAGVRRMETHDSPNKECKCGFYAHYAPDADFYTTTFWGTPSVPWGSSLNYVAYLPNEVAMVRAVVEMTGTVIMGTKGVRAQKMKVKALALDWSKYRGQGRVLDNGASFYTDGKTPPPPGYEWMMTTRSKAAAIKYKAEYFDDPADMYKAYPQPDLSALGIEPATPEPTPEPFRWSTYAPASVADAFIDNLRKALDTALDTLDPALDGGPRMFERAMKAKQSRPAPPGSGIDRRRGRLR